VEDPLWIGHAPGVSVASLAGRRTGDDGRRHGAARRARNAGAAERPHQNRRTGHGDPDRPHLSKETKTALAVAQRTPVAQQIAVARWIAIEVEARLGATDRP
jgi:hypothetical protein